MSERSEPDVRQTALEKVLIKHQAIKATRFKKILTEQARKQAAEICQSAQQEAEEIQRVAYQEGYQHGLQKLVVDLLQGLESSQSQYQQMLARSEVRLQTLLTEIFSDSRVYEIVSEHFIRLHTESPQIKMSLPPSLLKKLKPALAEVQQVTVLAGAEECIALEIENEILHFSPNSAAQSALPHIFSLSARCHILEARKGMYRKFSELLSQSGDIYDHNHASLHTQNGSSDHEPGTCSAQ
ncbi:HrpE/YscL family type III secretion apparatus protein [Yersinia bercovieri]|uniref:HrpE/YscL family type III secretion apparatus protein n=1 Tax=Yersinia bercovieri TaxID=634 RepID=UPI0011AB3A48|nr:HrpE/YscL family type III secretion apparatus protein [Yersinia bercovieri]